MNTGKHRIVIVGGSFGGVNAAYQLRRKLGERADLTLISAEPDFTFIPSLPWVMMGWRRPEALKVPLARPLARRGVRFVHDRATLIDPAAQSVATAGGESIGYDHLVLATGADLDWSNVPGSDPAEGTVHTCFTVEQAIAAREAIRRFVASDGGRAIIGANPGASCIGPAYEIIMMLETLLRRQKRRHLFDLHLVTPEPFLGHFGVNGIGNLSRMMKDEFRSRHLNWTTNAALTSVEPGKATLADGAEMPFDLAILIPAFYGAQVVRDVDGLGNPRGFIPTDRQLRSTRYPNIYAVGVSRGHRTSGRHRRPGRGPEDRPHDRGDGHAGGDQHRGRGHRHWRLRGRPGPAGDVRLRRGRHRLLHPRRSLPAAAQRRYAATRRPLPLPEARLRALLPGEDQAGPALAALRLVSAADAARVPGQRKARHPVAALVVRLSGFAHGARRPA